MPLLRKASSRSRVATVSQLKEISGKISGSAQKRTRVPWRSVRPATATGPWGTPRT